MLYSYKLSVVSFMQIKIIIEPKSRFSYVTLPNSQVLYYRNVRNTIADPLVWKPRKPSSSVNLNFLSASAAPSKEPHPHNKLLYI
jgi:hypothetical protein